MNGQLYVTSLPSSADVYLDDEKKGQTPLFINHLLVGIYNLKVVKGKKRWEKEIEIKHHEMTLEFANLIKIQAK
jgi:hypothetical protein